MAEIRGKIIRESCGVAFKIALFRAIKSAQGRWSVFSA
jgi:hypothetical protein